jgi:hypothetical protein
LLVVALVATKPFAMKMIQNSVNSHEFTDLCLTHINSFLYI